MASGAGVYSAASSRYAGGSGGQPLQIRGDPLAAFERLLALQERPRRRGEHAPTMELAMHRREGDAEEWSVFALGSLGGAEDAAGFFFPGDERRAAQAAPLLAYMCLSLYDMKPAQWGPLSLTVTTTSKRLLQNREHTEGGALGSCGSAACAAHLASVGLTPKRLAARPRRILELHLADLGRAAALVLPFEQALLDRRDGPAQLPRQPRVFLVDHKPPEGASKYTAGDDGHCHSCGAGVGVALKSCSKCRVARYCSKECQARDWPEHRPLCRQLAEWRAHVNAALGDQLQAAGFTPLKRF